MSDETPTQERVRQTSLIVSVPTMASRVVPKPAAVAPKSAPRTPPAAK